MNDYRRKFTGSFILCMFLFGEAISECPTSTAKIVNHCPQSEEKTKIAESKSNCKAKCNTLKYHCLPDTQMRKLFEVCAEEELIIGRVCAEYNTLGLRVQANRHNPKADCTTFKNVCPYHYQSTETYRYQECFLTVTNSSINPISKKKTEGLNPIIVIPTILTATFVIVIVIIFMRRRGSFSMKEKETHNSNEFLENESLSVIETEPV